MKIVSKIRTLGFGFVFERAFERIIPAWMCRIGCLAIYQVNLNKMSGGPRSTAALKICDSTQELEQLTEITRASGAPNDTVGLLATMDEVVAAGLWIALGHYEDHDLGLSFSLGNDGSWIYSARVDERYRRRGIYSHLMAESAQLREHEGHASPFIGVSKLNRGSHKAIQRLGTPVGQVSLIRLGSLVWAWSKGDLKQSQNVTLKCTRFPIQLRVSEKVRTTKI